MKLRIGERKFRLNCCCENDMTTVYHWTHATTTHWKLQINDIDMAMGSYVWQKDFSGHVVDVYTNVIGHVNQIFKKMCDMV